MVIRTLLALVALALAAGCDGGSESLAPLALKPEIVKSMERYSKDYVLAPGDQIEVLIYHVPELSRTVTVRPDGYVSLPTLKEVKAAGMTVAELDADLTKRFADRLVNPDVTVTVANPRAANVFVVGEVNKPGPLPARETPSVAIALASSGGVTKAAAKGSVAVIRLTEDGYLTGFVIDNQNSGDSAFYMAMSNMLLQPGDLVVVPESARAQFVRFIQDYVNTPLTGINQLLSPYFQYKILSKVS
jgi:polysaccharide biosynthesis/export protein